MTSVERAQSYSFPSPVNGWNARDPLMRMAETEAIEMVNIIPTGTVCKKRKGDINYKAGIFDAGSVNTLATLHLKAGTDSFVTFAEIEGTKYFYEITGTATDKTNGQTITNTKFQYCTFKNILHFVNGADAPLQWDGTTLTAPDWTGMTKANLIQVIPYKKRLYFVEKGTCKVWYSPVDSISGGLTAFDLETQFNNGGYLMFVASTTDRVGDTNLESMVFVSSEGEVLLYTGAYPGEGWAQIGHFFIGEPLGRKAYFYWGGDLYFITTQGVISFSDIVGKNTVGGIYATLSDKIDPVFADFAKNYRDVSGWEAIWVPEEKFILINVPLATGSGGSSTQCIYHTTSRGWCKFTNFSASTWAIYNKELYFAKANGNICKYYGQNDDDGSAGVPVMIRQAFNALGLPLNNKRFLKGRMYVLVSGDFSCSLSVDIDFDSSSIGGLVTVTSAPAAEWDEAEWDEAEWATEGLLARPWFDLVGVGTFASLKFSGVFTNIDFEIVGNLVLFEKAGVI